MSKSPQGLETPSRAARPPSMFGFLLGATAMFAAMYSTQAILPQISATFHVSAALSGLSISATIAMVALGGWIWGSYSDRRGRRRSLIAASALLIPPTVALAVVPNLWVLLVCRGLQGLCMPGLLTVGVPYVTEVYAPRLGGRAMGLYLVALVAGGLIGRIGVAELSVVVGWRGALATLAVLPAAGVLVMSRTLPEVTGRQYSARRLHGVLAQLRNPTLWRAAGAGSALLFCFVGVFSYVSYRLEAPPFSFGPAATSFIFVLWIVGAISPWSGRLADRIGWDKVALAALVCTGAGVLVTIPAVLPTVVLGLVLVATGMFGGLTAVQLGVAQSTTVDRGSASGLYFTSYYLTGALGAFVSGVAWQVAAWLGVALLCAALPLLMALVLVAQRHLSAGDCRTR
ncbi:MAG: MFS transporter [Acidimicrobiales bacterium]